MGNILHADSEWLRFLASSGAVLLTFLAGAELDPLVIRTKLTEVSVVGLMGFLAPFLGCAALAYYILGWDPQASWLCGIALSTTSMAVVYAVMLETGLNQTEYGKGVLASCFVNDLGTVIALGLMFAPFTQRTILFLATGTVVLVFFACHDFADDSTVRASDCRYPDQVGLIDFVRPRRAGFVVRE